MTPTLKRFIETIPECYMKYRLIAKYRWPFLEKERRERVMDAVIMREINRLNVHLSDILACQNNRKEKIFTVPTINLIESLVHEYGCQIGLFTDINAYMAIYRMASNGIINKLLMKQLKSLYEIREEILSTFFSREDSDSEMPFYFKEANNVLRMLEEALYRDYYKNSDFRPATEFNQIAL